MTPLPSTPPGLPHLPPRAADSHKGNYGRCLLVGGSRGMCGAIALAGRAALRSGAGLVTIATAAPNLELVAGYEPCYMTLPLPTDANGHLISEARDVLNSQPADCLACGPGLGKDPGVEAFVEWLYRTRQLPLVVDADGLNALARLRVDLRDAAGPRVLTPHPGEFRRLTADRYPATTDLRQVAREWAGEQAVVLVLKGHRTLVTDGQQQFENSTGNPGMATGGAGDVLTGIVTALIGQGLDPFPAACLAVHLHGLSGDLAASHWGQVSLIARDLIDYLPNAFRQHQASAAGHRPSLHTFAPPKTS